MTPFELESLARRHKENCQMLLRALDLPLPDDDEPEREDTDPHSDEPYETENDV